MLHGYRAPPPTAAHYTIRPAPPILLTDRQNLASLTDSCECFDDILNRYSQSLEEHMMQQQFQSCIEACNACADACDMCSAACLHEEDVEMMARCIALDMDCAQICRLAAAFMARGSDFAGALCQLCAEVCQACGDECAKHQAQHCQDCAAACRRCAEACRQMGA